MIIVFTLHDDVLARVALSPYTSGIPNRGDWIELGDEAYRVLERNWKITRRPGEPESSAPGDVDSVEIVLGI